MLTEVKTPLTWDQWKSRS